MAPLSSNNTNNASNTLSRNIVRSSRFRHVFGEPAKRHECYENINITRSAHDSNFCAVNPKFLAFVVECVGGGAFAVLPLGLTGRLNSSQIPTCNGHRAPCTDLKWNPFNDNVLASASEDGSIKLWYISDNLNAAASSALPDIARRGTASVNGKKALSANASNSVLSSLQPLVTLEGHSRRILYIEWHPTTSDILVSVGADHLVILWDVGVQSAIRVIDSHPDSVYSIAWNWYGSTLATTCKDKQLRLIEPRSNSVIGETQCHAGPKATKCLQMGRTNADDQNILTTGFSRYSDREFAIWDVRMLSAENNSNSGDNACASSALKVQTIDSSSGVVMPYYDADLSMLYIAGKGDGTIRYYEISGASEPYVHYLSQYQTSAPQRSLGVMPKRGLDTQKCEIWRFYKLHAAKNLIEPISMIVPRRTMSASYGPAASSSAMWSDDLYPLTPGPTAALSVDEWVAGRDESPVLTSLKPYQTANNNNIPGSGTFGRKDRSVGLRPGDNASPLVTTASTSPPSTNGADQQVAAGADQNISGDIYSAFGHNNPFLMPPPPPKTKQTMNTTNKPVWRREGTHELVSVDPNQERKFKWLVDTKPPDYRVADSAPSKKKLQPIAIKKSPETTANDNGELADKLGTWSGDVNNMISFSPPEKPTTDDQPSSQSGSIYEVAPNNNLVVSPPDNNNNILDFDYLQQHLSAPPRIGDFFDFEVGSGVGNAWGMGASSSSVSPRHTNSIKVLQPPDSTSGGSHAQNQTTRYNNNNEQQKHAIADETMTRADVEKKKKNRRKKAAAAVGVDESSNDQQQPLASGGGGGDGDITSKFSFTNDAVLLVGNCGPSTPSEATPSPTQALVCGFDYIVDEHQQHKQVVAVAAPASSAIPVAQNSSTAADELSKIVRRLVGNAEDIGRSTDQSFPLSATSSSSAASSNDTEQFVGGQDESSMNSTSDSDIINMLVNKLQRQSERNDELHRTLAAREQYIVQLETIIRCCGADAGEEENAVTDEKGGVNKLIDVIRRYTDSAIGNIK